MAAVPMYGLRFDSHLANFTFCTFFQACMLLLQVSIRLGLPVRLRLA